MTNSNINCIDQINHEKRRRRAWDSNPVPWEMKDGGNRRINRAVCAAL